MKKRRKMVGKKKVEKKIEGRRVVECRGVQKLGMCVELDRVM
jgi:hypothetical protein